VTARLTRAFLVVAVLVAGCDGKAPKVATSEAPAPAGNLREEAAMLAARGDYTAAERKYREALRAQPEDVDLRFGLGSVLSQLDRRNETAEEFRWVVKNGRPGHPEVDSARRWLADAGAATPTSTASSEPAPDAGTMGAMAGKITWPDLPPEKEFGIRIVVVRDADANVRKSARTKLNGTFSVRDLPEGTYKLTGLAGPTRIWSDLPVTVTSGRQTTIDLSPANAVVSATEFPARIR
jgi:hypothetical protein